MRIILDIRPRWWAFAASAVAFLGVAVASVQDSAPVKRVNEQDVHRVIGLLDYLSSDYPGAVKDGAVVNNDELEEQKSLSNELVGLCKVLPMSDVKGGSSDLDVKVCALRDQIHGLAAESEVQLSARNARKLVLERFDVRLAPETAPDLTRGKSVYLANCALCHGEKGDANTERARQLNPPPLSFLGDKARESLSPYQTFNVSTFGITGTSMASFDLLPSRERWDVAFYVASLRHPNPPAESPVKLPPLSLHELANLTDGQLEARLAELGREGSVGAADLAWLRAHPQGLTAEGPSMGASGRLARARAELARVTDLYRQGNVDEAVRVSIDSYLRDLEPVEMALRAEDAGLVARLETGFVRLRSELRSSAPAASIARAVEALDADLTLAEVKLSRDEKSPAVTFLASLFIIVREGVEAVLLIAAMLGCLRKLGRSAAARPIHVGWVGALAAGGLTWAVARWAITVSAAQRELVEGIVGLLAAGMLAYTSYWILSRSDSKRWLDFLRTQLSDALERRGRLALFGLAFLAVYREAFETVLFYEALLTERGDAAAPVLFGFLAGIVILTAVAVVIFRLSRKLPLQLFFTVSGALLYALAFVFAGGAIHALIEGGYLDPRPIQFPRIEWLGVYPDLLGVSLQAVFLAAVALGLWVELRSRRAVVAR